MANLQQAPEKNPLTFPMPANIINLEKVLPEYGQPLKRNEVIAELY